MATIEFYIGLSEKPVYSLEDSVVPRQGDLINIKKINYVVSLVTWAIDYADEKMKRSLRVNVVLNKL